MSKYRIKRTLGRSAAACFDCDWTWAPRTKGTATDGSTGNKNATMAAVHHGRTNHHRVRVTRESVRDFRLTTTTGTATMERD